MKRPRLPSRLSRLTAKYGNNIPSSPCVLCDTLLMEHEANFLKPLQEAIKFFSDPDTCITFMAQLRSPGNCSKCLRKNWTKNRSNTSARKNERRNAPASD